MPAVSRLHRTGFAAGPASPLSPSSPRSMSTMPDINSKALKITRTTAPKTMLPLKDLVFGHTFSDHMLIVEWSAKTGWEAPEIKPYGKLSLDPSCTVFHYAVECFEGMKAYKDKHGNIRMFRPDMNMNRLHRSCERLSLPSFNKEEFLESIKELLRLDSSWIPSERGYSLYIRPTAIATQESLGVGTSNKAMLFVICSPVGPYYKTGFNPVSLFATEHYVRAWPGGTGDAKLGSNYAPGIRPQLEVAKDGFQQNLWLFGPDQQITEVGTMNFFCFWKTPEGKRQLITPALDGTILPGVTRDSILTLAREWNEFEVLEGKLTMHELAKSIAEGRVLEVFGAGTAAIVSPVKHIHWRGQDLKIPLDPNDTTQLAGPLTRRLADTIMGIQYGEIPHPWSVKI